jgi:hypothetical protein
MSDEEELAQAVQKVIDDNADLGEISPAWVATAVMKAIGFPRDLHPLGYVGCHLELRQIARQKLRHQFDPTSAAHDEGEDLFPDTLQDRYPRRPDRGQEPVYVVRSLLSRVDVAYNVERMRRAGRALLRHADALEEWGEAHLAEPA